MGRLGTEAGGSSRVKRNPEKYKIKSKRRKAKQTGKSVGPDVAVRGSDIHRVVTSRRGEKEGIETYSKDDETLFIEVVTRRILSYCV